MVCEKRERMNPHWNAYWNRRLSRREMLRASGIGFGNLAFLSLLAEEAQADANRKSKIENQKSLNPLAPKAPMFPPRAKRVIFIFLHGGPSQMDTFDPKPLLTRDHG